MRRKLVAGNWKMHGSLAENETLLSAILAGGSDATARGAVCVPYPYPQQARAKLGGTAVARGRKS